MEKGIFVLQTFSLIWRVIINSGILHHFTSQSSFEIWHSSSFVFIIDCAHEMNANIVSLYFYRCEEVKLPTCFLLKSVL